MREKRLKRVSVPGLGLLGAGIVLVMLAFTSALPVAAGYGNPNYQGILSATTPSGYVITPASYNLAGGPANLTFHFEVTNLTDQPKSVQITFQLWHVLTYQGTDVSNGQPGQPGLDEATLSSHYADTTQSKSHEQVTTLNVPPRGGAPVGVTFFAPITACGYYQIDAGSGGDTFLVVDILAAGFTRALGCTPAPTPTPTATPTPTPTATGGVSSDTYNGGGGGGAGAGAGAGGGVAGATVTVPFTGTPIPFALGFGLISLGLGFLLSAFWPRGAPRTG